MGMILFKLGWIFKWQKARKLNFPLFIHGLEMGIFITKTDILQDSYILAGFVLSYRFLF